MTRIGRWFVLAAVSARPGKRSMSNNFNLDEVVEHPGSPALASEEAEGGNRRRAPRFRRANERRPSPAAPGGNRAVIRRNHFRTSKTRFAPAKQTSLAEHLAPEDNASLPLIVVVGTRFCAWEVLKRY